MSKKTSYRDWDKDNSNSEGNNCSITYKEDGGLVREEDLATIGDAFADSRSNLEAATFEEGLDAVLTEVREVILSKQHDYGHDNISRSPIAEISQEWGVEGIDEVMSVQLGIYTRLCDKIARLKSAFIRAGKMKNETMSDSWTDVIGYAVLAKMVARDTFKLPLREDL